ncbi:MAG: hypothetical protein NVS4B6_31840 [Mycobacterium sp.]
MPEIDTTGQDLGPNLVLSATGDRRGAAFTDALSLAKTARPSFAMLDYARPGDVVGAAIDRVWAAPSPKSYRTLVDLGDSPNCVARLARRGG